MDYLSKKKRFLGQIFVLTVHLGLLTLLANRFRHTAEGCHMIGHLSNLSYIDQTLKKFLSLSSNILSLFLSVNLYFTCNKMVSNQCFRNEIQGLLIVRPGHTSSWGLFYLLAIHILQLELWKELTKKFLESWSRQYFFQNKKRSAKSLSAETKKRLNTHEAVWGRTCLRRDHEAEHWSCGRPRIPLKKKKLERDEECEYVFLSSVSWKRQFDKKVRSNLAINRNN